MSSGRCVSCRFFEARYTEDNTVGFCRRFPPHGSGRMISDWAFPMVRRSDWCGEWRAFETDGDSEGRRASGQMRTEAAAGGERRGD